MSPKSVSLADRTHETAIWHPFAGHSSWGALVQNLVRCLPRFGRSLLRFFALLTVLIPCHKAALAQVQCLDPNYTVSLFASGLQLLFGNSTPDVRSKALRSVGRAMRSLCRSGR